jgi:APA family basic amino acid/polyamine antiporter
VVVVYAAMATAATSAFPPSKDPSAPAGYSSELSTKWLDAPILGLASAVGAHFPHPLDVALRVLVGLTATLILLLAMATSFSGCARLTSAMGEHLQLPSVFARRSRRTLTPPAGLAGVGVLSAAFLIVGAFFHGEEILTLASIYSFGILIALFLAQVSILWLRVTEPDMPRPFMMRGNVRIGGKLVPLTAAVGAVAAFAAWIIALGTHPGARDVGVLWMAGGILIYAVIRVRAGLPMLERVEPAVPPPEEWIAAPSGPIVVPLERNDDIGEEMMATAMRLAAENNSPVVGVSAIMIPVREPLDAPRPEREQQVEEVQRAAEELAVEYHVAYTPVVARTRSPGRLIVDAAVEHDAAMIVIGAPDKRRLAKSREEAVFGSTVDFVLRRAPCRVIVTHFPAALVGTKEAMTH